MTFRLQTFILWQRIAQFRQVLRAKFDPTVMVGVKISLRLPDAKKLQLVLAPKYTTKVTARRRDD